MKKLISHVKRLFWKFWFFLLCAFIISPLMGLGVLVIATILSVTLFSDPIDKDPADYFTEEELRMIQSDEVADDEKYLKLLARYQSFECPVKVDQITTWTSSEVTKDAFIFNYEINDRWHRYGDLDLRSLKSKILSQIDKKGVNIQRIIATNRNVIFRYWNRQLESFEDIVLSTDELRS